MPKLLIALSFSLIFVVGSASAQDAAKPAAEKPAAETPAKPAEATAPAATVAAPAVPAIKRVKMRSLMASGYEIKAVSFVPQDASSRVSKTLDKDAALITLQKGAAAATCFITLEEYVSPGMTDIEWCIEQK